MDFNKVLASNSKRFRKAVFRFPDRDVGFTYRELLDRSGRYCGLYRRRGLTPGTRVALWMGNVPEYALAFTAALRMGLVAVPVSVYEKIDKVSDVCRCSDCALMLYDSGNRFVRSALEKAEAIPEGWLDVADFEAAGGLLLPPAEDAADCAYDWSYDETYCILHSSGSTGARKAVCKTLSHTFGSRSTLRLLRFFLRLIQPFDRSNLFSVCPWYHTVGCILMLLTLSGGHYRQTVTEYFNPVHVARYLSTEKPNLWLGTATMLYRVCCANPDPELAFPGVVLSAGEALSSNILQTLSRQKGCRLLLSFYGITELGVISSLGAPLGPLPLRHRLTLALLHGFGLVGRPDASDSRADLSSDLGTISRDMDIRIRDDAGRLLPDGEAGEIFVKKAGAQRVYLNQDRPTDEVSSGDVGYKRGRQLFLLGRKKELIIRSGENIIPSEIEEQLLKCPGVEDAVVFGVPSPDHGEDVCACIQTAGAPDPEAIQAHLRDSLPRFMVPQYYLFREDFPCNASGKTDRKRIAAESRASLGL